MKLAFITQNVQGLNDSYKVDVVSNYFRKLVAGLDVLCFQEHRLRGQKLQDLHNRIWRNSVFSLKRPQ